MDKTSLIDTNDFQTSLERCLEENYSLEFVELLQRASGIVKSSSKGKVFNKDRERDYRMMLFGAYSAYNEGES